MAIPPSAANTLTPMAWPSALPQVQPYVSQPNVGLPQQGVTTFTPSTLPEAPETPSPSKANPYALPLTAAGGVVAGSFLPNPLGLFSKKGGAGAETLPALNINYVPETAQRVTIATPDNGETVLVSPIGHTKPTRLEVVHNPETSTLQPTLINLLKTSKDNNLPASTIIDGIPVFAHPKSTFNPDELATKLQAHLDAGEKPEWTLAERTLSDAEVDAAIKGQKMAFLNPEAETTFKAALADESDPIAKAGAEVAERLAKLFQHHDEHLFDVADKVIPNAMPEGLADNALIELAKLAPAGSALRSAEEGKQEILQEAFTLLNNTWQHGETLTHFLNQTHLLK
jgi:hypothetical protein